MRHRDAAAEGGGVDRCEDRQRKPLDRDVDRFLGEPVPRRGVRRAPLEIRAERAGDADRLCACKELVEGLLERDEGTVGRTAEGRGEGLAVERIADDGPAARRHGAKPELVAEPRQEERMVRRLDHRQKIGRQ